MNWNHTQKVAVLRTLIQISVADNEFANTEALNVTNYMTENGLGNNDIEEAKQMSDATVVSVIRNLSAIDKFYIKTLWINLIKVDGKIRDKEAELLVDLSLACDVDISELYK